ncbi:MAG: 3-deoxy-D-manno-octulosonic acid transferase [Bacteroidetes bacterium]|nr:3-deoxy-D-manno-octulosonic acid transferase [Bacteroidota bacterium]
MFGLLYRIGIELYFLLVRIVSPFNKKATLFLIGRAKTFASLAALPPKSSSRIWFHCASLGEFEQVKPIIEKLKQKQPHVFIAVSFFSPSGYESSKQYKHADWMGYLPKDTKQNARKFINLLQPDKAVYVKYEIWYFLLKELHKYALATYLISAKFREGGLLNPLIKPYFLPLLKGIKKIYLQDNSSYVLLKKEGFTQIELSGDTRVDRVLGIAAQDFDTSQFQSFIQGCKVLMGGSTWQHEENLLLEALAKLPLFVKLIIAPHDIKRSAEIQKKFAKYSTALFSQWNAEAETRVLIIDSIGNLSKLYRIANIALVGGGYHNALHNIYEPSVYGIPVLYGNNAPKYPEASLFAEKGIGFQVTTSGEIYNYTLAADSFYKEVKDKSIRFFNENKGICLRISNELLG